MPADSAPSRLFCTLFVRVSEVCALCNDRREFTYELKVSLVQSSGLDLRRVSAPRSCGSSANGNTASIVSGDQWRACYCTALSLPCSVVNHQNLRCDVDDVVAGQFACVLDVTWEAGAGCSCMQWWISRACKHQRNALP